MPLQALVFSASVVCARHFPTCSQAHRSNSRVFEPIRVASFLLSSCIFGLRFSFLVPPFFVTICEYYITYSE
nr:MAG TPA: hypothetical protein [Bacteriophage sp.]